MEASRGTSYTRKWDSAVPEEASARCPYCRRDVQMVRIGSSVETARTDYPRGGTEVVAAAAFVCPRTQCHKPTILVFRFLVIHGDATGLELSGQIPRGSAEPMEGLPEAVASVRDEAWSCFYGGDLRAAVVMGRAAVQRAVRTLGGKGRDLFTEIDSLYDQHKVTEELRDWAHEVRVAAREAAHPDELGDVTPEEANESLEWMDAFLLFAIALPERRLARRAGEETDVAT
jgi:Domain of unknown function (DUF4145)